jgi:hypothetical protein
MIRLAAPAWPRRPIGPQRKGIVIQDAPGLVSGWRRKCLACGFSVDSDHIPDSDSCFDGALDRLLGRSHD